VFNLDVEDLLDAIIAQLPSVDRLVLTNPVVVEVIRDDLLEAFRFRDTKALGPRVQDIQGALDQAAAIWNDWGFNLQEIYAPVSVLYGGQDLNVPPAAGAYQANHIAGSRPRFFPEDGHLSLFINHSEEILQELV
jgi:pimeloyl-ACP methyl ester carboxylesterase